MKLDRWLTVKENGSARITANKPNLEWNEISIHLLMEIPDALFYRPTIEACVVVPPEAAPPTRISAEVVERVGEAIRAATGMQVVLSVAEPEEGER